MKIITWNCNMAFRKKADLLLAYDPEILVIQECESIEKLKFNTSIKQPSDMLWFGGNPHKGVAILAFGDLKLKVLDNYNADLKTIVPVSVTGGGYDFNLFAVWANNPNDPDGQYVEQVWKAIHLYDDLLSPKGTILAGDFNSNAVWDRKSRVGNHSTVVERLEAKGIYSAYHLHHNQTQGKEMHPTFYLYRHQNKPYHLDYCFLSQDMAGQLTAVEVGDHEAWCKYSDHVPLMVTFEM